MPTGAGCVTDWRAGLGRRGGGNRQVDGEAVDIKTGLDEAAPLGSAQQLERKQHAAPGSGSRRVQWVRRYLFYDRTSSKVRENLIS